MYSCNIVVRYRGYSRYYAHDAGTRRVRPPRGARPAIDGGMSSIHDSQSVSQSVSQSFSYYLFHGPTPRAHPSTGSQSGSAAPLPFNHKIVAVAVAENIDHRAVTCLLFRTFVSLSDRRRVAHLIESSSPPRSTRFASRMFSLECALRHKQARRCQSENGGRIAAAVGAPFRQVVEERREHGARELA